MEKLEPCIMPIQYTYPTLNGVESIIKMDLLHLFELQNVYLSNELPITYLSIFYNAQKNNISFETQLESLYIQEKYASIHMNKISFLNIKEHDEIFLMDVIKKIELYYNIKLEQIIDNNLYSLIQVISNLTTLPNDIYRINKK